MGSPVFFDKRQVRVRLEEELGRGGEASIYKVAGRVNQVAKIYHTSPGGDYAQKLDWMQNNPPADPSTSNGHASIAWPSGLLYDRSRQLSGYLMPQMTGMVKLIHVINPALRRRALPGFNWKYLHRTARNLATAVKALHDREYVIGDLNESNILVSPTALVTLIDTDSFQVYNRVLGRLFHCPVGKPEYTPAELQGVEFRTLRRMPESDYFSLGVLIYQLLMEGSHPYRGQWMKRSDPPHISIKIQKGWFPYGKRHGPNLPPPNTPGPDVLGPELKRLVMRCFVEGHDRPARRPKPADWILALQRAEESLVECSEGHYFNRHSRFCPWCAVQRKRENISEEKKKKTSIRPTRPHTVPRLYVLQSQLHFGSVSIGERPQRTFILRNDGNGELQGTVASSARWLTAEPRAFNLAPGAFIQVQLTADTGGMASVPDKPLNPEAIVRIDSNGGQHKIQVQMRVGTPQLEIEKGIIECGRLVRGSTGYASLEIANTGSGTLSGKVLPRASWVSAARPDFSILPGGKTKIHLIVSTQQDADFPADGDYDASLWVQSNGGMRAVILKLEVNSPQMEVSVLLNDRVARLPPLVRLGVVPKGETACQRLTIQNTGEGELRGEIRSRNKWLQPDVSAFQVLPGESQTVAVYGHTRRLRGSSRGKIYDSYLMLETNGGRQKIPFRILVAAPRLRIEQEDVNFPDATIGETIRTFLVIQNNGLGMLEGVIRSSAAWIYPEEPAFCCQADSRVEVPILLDTNVEGIPLGEAWTSPISVETNGGKGTIPAHCRVNAGALNVLAPPTVSKAGEIEALSRLRFAVDNRGSAVLAVEADATPPWRISTAAQLHIPPGEMAALVVDLDPVGAGVEEILRGRLQVSGQTGKQVFELSWTASEPVSRVISQSYEVYLPGGARLGFVFVPEGSFRMGGPDCSDPSIPRDERIATDLHLPAYWIGKVPVTNQIYGVFVAGTGHPAPPDWKGGSPAEGKGDHPVANVSWEDAKAFCRWASRMCGLTVRLPSEAEWEKAARGDDDRIWAWGDQPPDRERCNFESMGTTPVGQFGVQGASPYGCREMNGNVWEWTGSRFAPYPYDPGDGREDPDAEGSRVLRGGSWFSTAMQTRSTMRLRSRPDQARPFFGLRCVLEV